MVDNTQNEILVGIGALLRETRSGTPGLTQEKAAERAGMTRPRYVELEQGKLDVRVTTLVNAARALGLELMFVPSAYVPAVNAIVQPAGSEEDVPMFQPDRDDEEQADVTPRPR